MKDDLKFRIDYSEDFIKNASNDPIERLCFDITNFALTRMMQTAKENPDELYSINHFKLTACITTNLALNLLNHIINHPDAKVRRDILYDWVDKSGYMLKEGWNVIETDRANIKNAN